MKIEGPGFGPTGKLERQSAPWLHCDLEPQQLLHLLFCLHSLAFQTQCFVYTVSTVGCFPHVVLMQQTGKSEVFTGTSSSEGCRSTKVCSTVEAAITSYYDVD